MNVCYGLAFLSWWGVYEASWILLADELALTGVRATILPSGEVLYFSYDPAQREHSRSVHIGSCGTKFAARQGTSQTSRPESLLCRSLLARRWTAPCGRRAIEQLGMLQRTGAQTTMCIHILMCIEQSWTRQSNMPEGRCVPYLWSLWPTGGISCSVRYGNILPQNYVNHEFEIFDWRTRRFLHRRAHLTQAFMDASPLLGQLIADGSSEGILWVHSGTKARPI